MVQQKIIDLECELAGITTKETRDNVQKLLDAYQHRLKQLNLEMNPYGATNDTNKDEENKKKENQEKTPKQGETYEIDETGTIEILDTPDDRKREQKVYQELEDRSDSDNSENESVGDRTPMAKDSKNKRNKDTNGGSGNSSKKKVPKVVTPSRDVKNTIKPRTLWRHTGENDPTPAEAGAMLIVESKKKDDEKDASTKKEGNGDYKDALTGKNRPGKSPEEKANKNEENEIGKPRKDEIRISFTYKADIRNGEDNADCVKRLLKEMIPKIK